MNRNRWVRNRWVPGVGVAVIMTLASCGSSDSHDAGATKTDEKGGSTTISTTEGASAAVDVTVKVAENGKFGKFLVGANGRTLYLFEKDQATESACTGGCAKVWPALTSTGAPSSESGVDMSRLATFNGQVPDHVAYNGHPLYFYTGDTAPGEVNGASVPMWYPIDPNGDKIDLD
ncbi:MAG: hypothetical protein HYR89_05900 [Actinobacteria bacterium]|nr:hypothetical protein [Actinomycetota bacterium]